MTFPQYPLSPTPLYPLPSNYSDVFATCSFNDIRVWNAKNRQELLRIQVPNLECNCVAFMNDGKSILSGWNDGKVRSFFPQSGKLMYLINDAHIHGVTAITTTNDCQRFPPIWPFSDLIHRLFLR